MVKKSFAHRFLIPLGLVVGTWAVSALIYDAAAGMKPGMLRDSLIGIFGPLLFLSIWFFAFVGPPLAYVLGADFKERLIIALVNPVFWVIRVEAQLSCQFSPVELVYFFFLPWTFGVVCVALLEFSIVEIVCRSIHRYRSKAAVRIFHPGVWVLLIISFIGTYVGLGRGQEWVYWVVHHYADHFLK